ncbi:MAG TPA: hypothetical protein VGB26_14580 [Nitrospiria bacterium]
MARVKKGMRMGWLFVFLWIVPSWAGETSVIILSPREGEIQNSQDVKIEVKFERGDKGDHLHFYLDGKYFKTSRRDSTTLWDVKEGKHTIEVRAASREKDEKGVEHKELGPKASVKIEVQSSEKLAKPQGTP